MQRVSVNLKGDVAATVFICLLLDCLVTTLQLKDAIKAFGFWNVSIPARRGRRVDLHWGL